MQRNPAQTIRGSRSEPLRESCLHETISREAVLQLLTTQDRLCLPNVAFEPASWNSSELEPVNFAGPV